MPSSLSPPSSLALGPRVLAQPRAKEADLVSHGLETLTWFCLGFVEAEGRVHSLVSSCVACARQDGPQLLQQLAHPHPSCALWSEMKAEAKGATLARMHSELAPPGPQASKGRTEVQIKERVNNSELREDQETADARPRISKDRQPSFSPGSSIS